MREFSPPVNRHPRLDLPQFDRKGSLIKARRFPLVGSFAVVSVVVGMAAIASAADLLVSNYGANTIDEYTTSGTTVNASLITGLGGPSGTAVSGGDIFVANFAGYIGEYTTAGAVVNPTLINNLIFDPFVVAVSGSDLFVLNNSIGTIGEYTTSGSVVNANLVTGLLNPKGMAISGGDLFVTNGSVISEYTTSGSTVNASLISGLSPSASITISGNDLFVVAQAQGKVSEYTTAGGTVNASLVTGLNNPFGIAVSGGDLFVSRTALRSANTPPRGHWSTQRS